jgi:uncharacterized ubiquitin-like protein YukD
MDVQTCAYTSPNVSNNDSNYGKINITSVIMCFLIIYSTALSIVLSVKQLIQVIKEEELLNEEEDEEEVIDRVEVQTQTNEENYKKEEEKKDDEEEILLANYNAKERALALQAAYDEQLQVLFEKRINLHKKVQSYYNNGRLTTVVPHKQTLNEYLLSIIQDQVLQSFTRDIETIDKEIIIMAKKARLFGGNSDLLLKELDNSPNNTLVSDYKYIFSII